MNNAANEPKDKFTEFACGWNHIITALELQLFPEISKTIKKIIFGKNAKFQIQLNDFSDETIGKVLDQIGKNKNQKSLSNEQKVFINYLIKKARIYDPITQSSLKEIVDAMSLSTEFNENGIIHWLGTDRNTREWENPAVINNLKLTSSSLGHKSASLNSIVGKECVLCYIENTKSCGRLYIMIDLLNTKVLPTHYSLKHYTKNKCFLRNWYLLGCNNSTDGLNGDWDLLSRHVNDTALNKAGSTCKWSISTNNVYSQ
eukprot:524945_1